MLTDGAAKTLQVQKKWKAYHLHPPVLLFFPFWIPSLCILFSCRSKETCFQHINMEGLEYTWNEFYCPVSLSSLIEFSWVHVSPNATLTQRCGLAGRRLSRFVSVVVNMREEFIPLYSVNHTAWNRWLSRAGVSRHQWGGSRDRRLVKDLIGQEGKSCQDWKLNRSGWAASLFWGQTGATERFALCWAFF